MRRNIILTGLLGSLGLAVVSCGGSDEDSLPSSVFAAGEVSLEKFPNLSALISQEAQSSLSLAVSGTPVALKELKDDPDTYFFNGAIAALVDDNASPTEELRGDMERGQAVCGMAANAGELIRRISGGTLCYMGEIAKLPSGSFDVTKESASVTSTDHSEIFQQEAADKLVRVDLPEGEQGYQSAHFKIIGTDNAPNAYQIDFFMCAGDSEDSLSVESAESYVIDYAAGSYSRTEAYSGEGDPSETYVGKMLVSAFLRKAADGSFEFDPTKDRIITEQNNHSRNSPAGEYNDKRNMSMRIDSAGNLHTLIYRTGGSNNYSSSEKIWSMAEFAGSGLDIGISQMAMKMDRSHSYQGNAHTADGVGGAVEWQDTAYQNTEEGAYFASFQATDLAAETFFSTSPSTETFDKSPYDCNETVDIAIEVDMNSDALAPVILACEGNEDDNHDFHGMCYQGDVNEAFNKLYQQQ